MGIPSDVDAIPVQIPAEPAPAAPAPDKAERLRRAREAAKKRDEARAAERSDAELEGLELEERLEKTIGKRGQSYEIVDASEYGDGFIAVKLGEDVSFNTFKASKMDVADTDVFVVPNLVHPSVDVYRRIVARRPYLADMAATKLAGLYGFKVKADAGK